MAFAREVAEAMRRGVHLLLLHEMPGGEEQAARHGVEFGTFFAPPPVGTPPHLVTANVYGQIAVALKGGEYRKVSMALFAQALADGAPDECKPVKVDEPPEYADLPGYHELQSSPPVGKPATSRDGSGDISARFNAIEESRTPGGAPLEGEVQQLAKSTAWSTEMLSAE